MFEKLFRRRKPEQERPLPEAIDNLKTRRTERRGLAYSPEFKMFAGKNKGLIFNTAKLLKEKRREIEAGHAVERNGVRIVKAKTGQFWGNFPLTVSIKFGGKEFFLKETEKFKAECNLFAFQRIDRFLRANDYKFSGFNVRPIKPHFVYVGEKEPAYIATDFYSEAEVEQVCSMKRNSELEKALKKLRKKLKAEMVSDAHPGNIFYNKKTNTLLLFDLSID